MADGQIHRVPFGAAATATLSTVLSSVRAGDAFTPVTVVVPTATVGVTLRRALARPGLVNVRFSSLPQLAERLAAPMLARAGHTQPSAAARAAAVRAVLAHDGDRLSHRRSPATEQVVAGALAELDAAEVDEPRLAVLAAHGGLAAETARLYRAYHRRLGPDTTLASDSAVQAVTHTTSADAEPVVLHLPGRLLPGQLRLCRALAEHGRLHVVLGVTGDPDADADAGAVAAALGDLLGVVDQADGATPPTGTAVLLAPDPEEEVRWAVRRVLAHLHAGGRADRAALVYRRPDPYARLLHEQLTAAGLPHPTPPRRTLAQSIVGRTLLGLPALAADGFPRADLMAWLGGAPVLDAGGTPVRVMRWDTVAREAGASRGLAQWRQRLDRYADDCRARAAEADDTEPAGLLRLRAADADALRDYIDTLAAGVSGLSAAATWAEAAAQARLLVDACLGGLPAAATWGPREPDPQATVAAEQAAYQEVTDLLDDLAGLDPVDPPNGDPAGLRLPTVLATELERPLREPRGLGRGVLTGPVADFAGADLDLVVVLGMTEGDYPSRPRPDPLLPDPLRAQVGLLTAADRRASERRATLAVVAAAPDAVLSHAVADPRAQRGRHPSPWLLDGIAALPADRIERPASFEAALRAASHPLGTHEHDTAALLATSGTPTSHPLTTDPVLGRALAAAAARAGPDFGPWLGGLTTPPDVAAALDRTMSATSLQDYAACPFRYLLARVLEVREPVSAGDDDLADPRDVGTLLHEVLEDLVGRSIGRAPQAPWSPDERRHAQQVLQRLADDLRTRGKAGRARLWEARTATLSRVLRRSLAADDAYRADRRAVPVAVELAFGTDDAAVRAVEIALPSGTSVRFRGRVDRVDRTVGGVLVVLDYKSGSGSGYDDIPEEGVLPGDDHDLVVRGTRLQLPLYALAARQAFPDAGGTEAWFWFVETGTRRGGVVGDAEVGRLRDVLDVVVGGVRAGTFPARPGPPGFRGHENCRYCPFDRVCPTTRDAAWESLRDHPRVRAYAALAEPPDLPAGEPA